MNFHKTYYFHNIRLMIDFFFLARELIFFTEWKLPISLFDKIFTIASELIIKLTSIIFYILGYWLFSEFLFNFKTILLLDIFHSWTFDKVHGTLKSKCIKTDVEWWYPKTQDLEMYQCEMARVFMYCEHGHELFLIFSKCMERLIWFF